MCVCKIRLSYGVMHRLPRVFPDQPLQYKDWVIPIGVRQSDHLLSCPLWRFVRFLRVKQVTVANQ